MSVQNLTSFGQCQLPTRLCCLIGLLIPLLDPFADEGDPLGDSKDVGSQQNYIHIRIQQRNGRKTLTTLQGLPKGIVLSFFFGVMLIHYISLTEYDAKKLLKAFKKVMSAPPLPIRSLFEHHYRNSLAMALSSTMTRWVKSSSSKVTSGLRYPRSSQKRVSPSPQSSFTGSECGCRRVGDLAPTSCCQCWRHCSLLLFRLISVYTSCCMNSILSNLSAQS
jgi:translation initiation factor 1 (eIF-1/SUI1)